MSQNILNIRIKSFQSEIEEISKTLLEKKKKVSINERADYCIKATEKFNKNVMLMTVPKTSAYTPINTVLEQYHLLLEKCKQTFNNYIEGLKIGENGEKNVYEALRIYDNTVFKIEKNILLENILGTYAETAEIDMIIFVPEKGIFILEIKAWGETKEGEKTKSIQISKDGKWSWNNNPEFTIESPVEQNMRHLYAVKYALNEIISCNYYSVIVFSNNDVELNNQSESTVLRTSELLSYINTRPNLKAALKKEDIEIACNLLEESDKKSRNGKIRVTVPDIELIEKELEKVVKKIYSLKKIYENI